MREADDEAQAGRRSGDADEGTSSLQLLTSACWLSLKEAALVVGILARHIPPLGKSHTELGAGAG